MITETFAFRRCSFINIRAGLAIHVAKLSEILMSPPCHIGDDRAFAATSPQAGLFQSCLLCLKKGLDRPLRYLVTPDGPYWFMSGDYDDTPSQSQLNQAEIDVSKSR